MNESTWLMAICLSFSVACGGPAPTATDAGGGGTDAASITVQGSCDHRPSGSTDCLDFEGYPTSEIDRLSSECIDRGETWSLSACNRTGAIGGCRYVAAGMTNTYWFYSGDVATQTSSCTTGGATWVSP